MNGENICDNYLLMAKFDLWIEGYKGEEYAVSLL